MHRRLRSLWLPVALLAPPCVVAPFAAAPAVARIGPGPADAPIDAEMRTRVLDSPERRLSDFSVFPDVAAKMVDALKAHAAKHDCDGIGLAAQLAQRLTADLQSVSHDRHARVLFGSAPAAAGPVTPEEREVGTKVPAQPAR